MGKKKRYIHRAAKFGKKAFNFLDGLDGLRDAKLLDTKLDTLITKLTLVDRGNQTYAIQVEGTGPGGDPSNDALQNDKVKYIVDGVTVHADNYLTFAAAADGGAGNRDEYLTNFLAPAAADATQTLGEDTGVALSVGEHTIKAIILTEALADLSKQVSQKLVIAPASVDISAITAAKGNGTGGGQNGAAADEIAFAAGSAIKLGAANTAGAAGEASGRAAGEQTFDLGTGGSKNDLKITMKTKQDADVTFGADDHTTGYSLADGGKTILTTTTTDLNATVLRLEAATSYSSDAADNPHVMTVTPRKKDGTELTADAITISVDLT